ncbi:MAG: CvpA family protein, partial [Dongiaceae bacterium]
RGRGGAATRAARPGRRRGRDAEMMDGLSVNALDLAILGVVLLCGLLTFAAGIVRTVLWLAAWVVAAFATIHGFPLARPFLRPFLRQYIETEWIADVLTGIAIFVIVLMIGIAVSHALSRNVRRSAFSAVDRSLGLLFGLAIGAVLVSLAYLLMERLVPEEERPTWIIEARTMPLVREGAEALGKMLSSPAAEGSAAAVDQARRTVEQAIEAEKALRALGAPPPAEAPNPAGSPESSGYKDGERKELDRLIQGAQ